MPERVRGLRAWHLPAIIWLTLIWVLLWGELNPINLVSGVLVSCLVVAVFPFPRVSISGSFRLWPSVVLISRFLIDLVIASFHVAWLAIRPGPAPRSAVVRIDLVSASELRQTLTGELISLVPGSLLIELDSVGRRLWLHVLDCKDTAEADSARLKARLQEHRLLKAIGTDAEVAESQRRLQEGS